MPVDTRNLFKDDHIILRFEISKVDISKFSLKPSIFNIGDIIYASLNIAEDKKTKIENINKEKPVNKKYIHGVIKNIYGNKLNIEYGIENFVIPIEKIEIIEKELGKIYAKVIIDDFGNAEIKSLILNNEDII